MEQLVQTIQVLGIGILLMGFLLMCELAMFMHGNKSHNSSMSAFIGFVIVLITLLKLP